MLKYLLIIFSLVYISGCTEVKPDSSQNITENQKDSTHEINMIFGEANPENMTYYNSAGAEYVIFKIKPKNMDLKSFNNLKMSKIKQRVWIYLRSEGFSQIFCRNQSQLEVSIPKSIIGNSELKDGDILRQNEIDWNITLYRPKKIKTACSL